MYATEKEHETQNALSGLQAVQQELSKNLESAGVRAAVEASKSVHIRLEARFEEIEAHVAKKFADSKGASDRIQATVLRITGALNV